MRVFYSLLTTFIAGSLAVARNPKGNEQQINLFQARGLKKHHCYRELAAVTCQQDCMLTLFPRMSAQLNLRIKDMPPKARKEMGHFFLVDFKVLDEQATSVALLKWQAKTIAEVRKALSSSVGIVKGHACR